MTAPSKSAGYIGNMPEERRQLMDKCILAVRAVLKENGRNTNDIVAVLVCYEDNDMDWAAADARNNCNLQRLHIAIREAHKDVEDSLADIARDVMLKHMVS